VKAAIYLRFELHVEHVDFPKNQHHHMLVLHSVVDDPFSLDNLCHHGLCCDFVELVVMDYGENDVVKENEHVSFLYDVLISCLEV